MDSSFAGKKVLVMGLGLQGGGLSSSLFFAKEGAQVTVTDLKTKEELLPSVKKLKNFPIRFVLGRHDIKDFKRADLVIVNPAVSLQSPYLKIAEKEGVPLEMAESLFLKLSGCDVIGVTGTRGKTTTATLIAHTLKAAGFDVLLGGNIPNRSALPFLKRVNKRSKVVLELSSFQLAFFHRSRISPNVSVLTNIYEDHLNRYANIEEYMHDKSAIFAYQRVSDFLVANKDNPLVRTLIKNAPSKKILFQKEDITFPIKLKGSHNLENAAAAFAVSTKIYGVDKAIAKRAIQAFKGLPHRLEEISVKLKVVFVNDTTSTTPIALIAALKAIEGPIVLIMGGNSKNLSIDDAVEEVARCAKAVVFLKGNATEKFSLKLKSRAPNLPTSGPFENLKDAVKLAFSRAVAGDTILLSPGFTSFSMFKNEFDRGEAFKQIVKNL